MKTRENTKTQPKAEKPIKAKPAKGGNAKNLKLLFEDFERKIASPSTWKAYIMINIEELLVGKTLSDVELASDKKAIRFTVDGEQIVAKCDADCCSETWIESVELPAGGLPAKILDIGNLNLPEDKEEDYETIKYYGLKLITDKGDFVLDYRNSSNGYYGGNLSWPGEYHYGGVYGQNDSTEEYESLKCKQ